MSEDLATQIRDYAAEVDAAQAPVTFDELADVRVGRGPVRPVIPRSKPATSPGPRRQIVLVAAGVAVAILLLVGGAAWLSRAPQVDIVDQPTATSVPPFGADDALAVADAYFAAYNDGDVDGVKALFGPDAEFSTTLGSLDRVDWEQLLVWNAAQGTVVIPRNCRVDGVDSGVSVTLLCPHSNLDALVQAVDGPPVAIGLTLVVTPTGIQKWASIFTDPDFNVVGRPFEVWMVANHPNIAEAGTVGFTDWATVEEAEQNGILTAQYAAEWATYLNENDCIYSDGC